MSSNLIIYNCSGADATVTLNPIMKKPWTLKNSGAGINYYPSSQTAPRDLSKEHGSPGNWGQNNKLRIAWKDIDELFFQNIQDPPKAFSDVDLLMWIFSDRVVFSQGTLWLGEVTPPST
jgi:hypothetical protein